MQRNNHNQKDTASIILTTITVFVGVHLLLSYAGLIPSEVSVFNNQMAQTVQSLHTIEYQRDFQQINKTDKDQDTQTNALPQAPSDLPKQTSEKPRRIIIDKIGVDTEIANPTSTSLSVLNDLLDQSAVRYPQSGRLNSERPMFLFAHSSRLPVVENEAYKSFNGLGELTVGDEITVKGSSTQATYRVMSVDVVKKDEGFVSFDPNQSTDLTLSTCSTFGTKQNRTIVRARKM